MKHKPFYYFIYFTCIPIKSREMFRLVVKWVSIFLLKVCRIFLFIIWTVSFFLSEWWSERGVLQPAGSSRPADLPLMALKSLKYFCGIDFFCTFDWQLMASYLRTISETADWNWFNSQLSRSEVWTQTFQDSFVCFVTGWTD